MLLGMLSLSFNRSGKGFGYALGINAVPKAKRVSVWRSMEG